MDLTRQPPRRPSNAGIAGIVGLARMTDKARGENAELIGEYKYGEASGLDCEVLELIGMNAPDFADAADRLWDRELEAWVLEQMSCTQSDIDAFNQAQLTREPFDELHRRLLVERIAKFAPGNTDITTVFASIELDDWGAFRDVDLTVRPPRTAFLRSVVGIVGVARMADKARGHRAAKLGAYKYGNDSFVDREILKFLGISAEAFEEAAWRNPNDTELAEWIGTQSSFTASTVSVLNEWLTGRGIHTPGIEETFRARRDEVCPDRPEVQTYFELMDIDDEASLGIVDLSRRPPRSPFDNSLGGAYGLARMIDKARAHNAGLLGEYWFGGDSGFDKRVLDFLGMTQDAFAEALQQHATDTDVVRWLGDRLTGREADLAAFNQSLVELAPTNDGARAFLTAGVRSADPARSDIGTFMALTLLDDQLFLARLRSRV
ncbi:MAG: DUF5069 domain-containing protein [Gemmatimonadetes bacterium]|jgi:hypothetical protein|nr:DUF5069 domain-containing protein [Gemmatimonadota bacterium]